MTAQLQPTPLFPDPTEVARRNVASLVRAVIASATGKLQNRGDERAILKQKWPDDLAAPLILRASSAPHSLTNTSTLAASIVADVIATLAPKSASATLLQSGLQLSFDRYATIYVPSVQAFSTQSAFVGEGAPIPIHDFTAAAASLVPRKIATGVVLTREMVESSNAEAIVTDVLMRSIGLRLDAVLFVAADTIRPAGLRAGISALTAAAGTAPDEVMVGDLTNIGGAVSVLGADPIFIVAPPRAISINRRARREFPYTVLASPALAAGDVIAISPVGLASVVADMPRIETSRAGTLHMEDATPLPIVSGSPGTVASPARELWQTDAVSLRVIFNGDWCVRDPRAVAWTTASAW